MATELSLKQDFELLRSQCLQQLEGLNHELVLFKQQITDKVAWLHQQSEQRLSRRNQATQQQTANDQERLLGLADLEVTHRLSQQVMQLTQVRYLANSTCASQALTRTGTDRPTAIFAHSCSTGNGRATTTRRRCHNSNWTASKCASCL